ncbi:hypothetical protein HAX54_037453, partial [Datura stramonium]|nr:hypothetical protein [Datura stramonium]
ENWGSKFSTSDKLENHRSRSANRQYNAGSGQRPEANISPNQRFIGISPDRL